MNIGSSTMLISSICWKVLNQLVTAMPTAANPSAISTATGTMANAHQEVAMPSTPITPRKAQAYSSPRNSAIAISPAATSSGPSEVDSIAS